MDQGVVIALVIAVAGAAALSGGGRMDGDKIYAGYGYNLEYRVDS